MDVTAKTVKTVRATVRGSIPGGSGKDKYVESYRIVTRMDDNTHWLYLVYNDKTELEIPLPKMGIDIDRVVKFGTEDPTEDTSGQTKQIYVNTTTGTAWVLENGQMWPHNWIPISGGGTVKTVNGVEPDENGNVQIDLPENGSDDAVLYTEQGLTEEQQMQARANMGLYNTKTTVVKTYDTSVADIVLVRYEDFNDGESVRVNAGGVIYEGTVRAELISPGEYGIVFELPNVEYPDKSRLLYDPINGCYEMGSLTMLPEAPYNVTVYKIENSIIPEKYIPDNIARKTDTISGTVYGASVGQIAKITAVDENGAPTGWEPIDGTTGGYDVVVSGTVDEDVTMLEFEGIENYNDFLFIGEFVGGNASGVQFYINGNQVGGTWGAYFVHNHTKRNITKITFYRDKNIVNVQSVSPQKDSIYNQDSVVVNWWGQTLTSDPVTRFAFKLATADKYIKAGSTYTLWGRK